MYPVHQDRCCLQFANEFAKESYAKEARVLVHPTEIVQYLHLLTLEIPMLTISALEVASQASLNITPH